MSLRLKTSRNEVTKYQEVTLQGIIMQEILTVIAYPIVWIICAYLLKIESGLAKLLISLTAAILVYVLIGIKLAQNEKDKENKD